MITHFKSSGELKTTYMADRSINWYDCFGRLAFYCKVKHTHSIQPRNPTPEYLPTRNKNICSYKDLYMNVYSSVIHNSQKLKITMMSIKWISTFRPCIRQIPLRHE